MKKLEFNFDGLESPEELKKKMTFDGDLYTLIDFLESFGYESYNAYVLNEGEVLVKIRQVGNPYWKEHVLRKGCNVEFVENGFKVS
jgi:sulfur carrier protein ThiS